MKIHDSASGSADRRARVPPRARRSSVITRISCVLGGIDLGNVFRLRTQIVQQMLHRFHAHLPLGFRLIFGDAAQHRQPETRARRQRQQHALLVDQRQPVPRRSRQWAGWRTPPACVPSIVTTIRFGQTRDDRGRAHPVDRQQMPAPLGQRNLENALARSPPRRRSECAPRLA